MSEEAVSLDRLAKIYLKMRAAIQQLQQEYDEKIEELKAQQTMVSLAMKDQMLTLGLDSVKTASGTIMLGKKQRFFTQDWDSFKRFIVERDAVDLLERRIHQGNMQHFLEENPGQIPPGLNAETEFTVSVRKPK